MNYTQWNYVDSNIDSMTSNFVSSRGVVVRVFKWELPTRLEREPKVRTDLYVFKLKVGFFSQWSVNAGLCMI